MITTNINEAIKALNNGDIVAIPTETVYGLAANAFNESALKKIFELKKRPLYNPLIVHIKSINELNSIAKDIPEKAIKLANKFWPGALTLVLKKQSNISDIISAGKETVAVRVPNHKLTLNLLSQLNFPLAAPSANPFGSISPTSAKHVHNYFKENLSVIIDGGKCEKGIESTIIGFENDLPVLFRHGSIAIEEIENVIGKVIVKTKTDSAPDAPGMLLRHYAPKTQTYLTNNINELMETFPDKKIGVILFKQSTVNNQNNPIVKILSKNGNLDKAAKKLYATMHELDNSNLDIIIAEKLPNKGIGKSINDRLERAIKK